jgi:hypothetical protein
MAVCVRTVLSPPVREAKVGPSGLHATALGRVDVE